MGRKKSATKAQEFIPKVKMICPQCNQESYVTIEDYKVNKQSDGVIYIYKCLSCKDTFKKERKYVDI